MLKARREQVQAVQNASTERVRWALSPDAEELLVAVVRGSQLSLMVQSWSVDQLGTGTHP